MQISACIDLRENSQWNVESFLQRINKYYPSKGCKDCHPLSYKGHHYRHSFIGHRIATLNIHS
ncbi:MULTISPECIES: hypothetical protein [unclassified Bartonella]|uniref:hypothetical protein n=1 Tax=Bartonella TaxID=773 RepID=UPI0035D02864